MNILCSVLALKELLKILVEDFGFTVCNIWTLGVPRNQLLPQLRQIYNLILIPVRRGLLAPFAHKVSLRIHLLVCTLEIKNSLVIASQVTGLYRTLRVGVDAYL